MAGKAFAAAAVMVGVGFMMLGLASAAQRHTSRVSASCVEQKALLSVQLTKYASAGRNTVIVHDNGVRLVDSAFGDEYCNKWTDRDGDVPHRFVVTVVAWDDPDGSRGWSFRNEVEVPACVSPGRPVTTSPAADVTTSPPAGPGESSKPLAQLGALPVTALVVGSGLLAAGVGVGAVVVVRRVGPRSR